VIRALRKHLLLLVALVCALAAIVLGLLAADVAAWRSTVARDDLRFRASPTHAALWEPSTHLPGDPASALVGTGSTIQWRRTLQYFWYSRIGSNPEIRMDTPTLRAEAQDKLLKEIASAPTPAQRSKAANLLGVLVVTTPAPGRDQDVILQILKRAAGYFQQAIEIDPANVDAKQNLELVYRIAKPGKGHLGRDARSGYGFGKGQGAVSQGSGY
jgi:hypothetical protein